jgi:hypothetical protein
MNLLKFQFLTDNTIAHLNLKPYFYRKKHHANKKYVSQRLMLGDSLSGKISMSMNFPLSYL